MSTPASPRKLLLDGAPRAGKTTVARRLAALLLEAGVPVGGFTTQELRRHGQRVGFRAEEVNGPSAVIAHVDWTAGPAVGRYRVDVAAFERVALPSLRRARELGGVTIIDELGRMELASPAFVRAVQELFSDRGAALVATVHVARHPVTDALKRHPGVQQVTVTPENRDALPGQLAERLAGGVRRQQGS